MFETRSFRVMPSACMRCHGVNVVLSIKRAHAAYNLTNRYTFDRAYVHWTTVTFASMHGSNVVSRQCSIEYELLEIEFLRVAQPFRFSGNTMMQFRWWCVKCMSDVKIVILDQYLAMSWKNTRSEHSSYGILTEKSG